MPPLSPLTTCNTAMFEACFSSINSANLHIQLCRLQIDARKQGTIIILHARVVDRSPALSRSRRFVVGRMVRDDRSGPTSVQIPTGYERAHVHIVGKYVVAYQFRKKMYQVGKHGSVLRAWVVFCNGQRTNETAYTQLEYLWRYLRCFNSMALNVSFSVSPCKSPTTASYCLSITAAWREKHSWLCSKLPHPQSFKIKTRALRVQILIAVKASTVMLWISN
jgi:hypothetical protein